MGLRRSTSCRRARREEASPARSPPPSPGSRQTPFPLLNPSGHFAAAEELGASGSKLCCASRQRCIPSPEGQSPAAPPVSTTGLVFSWHSHPHQPGHPRDPSSALGRNSLPCRDAGTGMPQHRGTSLNQTLVTGTWRHSIPSPTNSGSH